MYRTTEKNRDIDTKIQKNTSYSNKTEQFTYLGVTIDKYGIEDKEIDKRLTQANGAYFPMSHVLRSRHIDRQIKNIQKYTEQ